MLAHMMLLLTSVTPEPDPGAIFQEWIGSCFQAKTSQGMPDTHCFTEAAGGKLMMDVHKVRDAEDRVVYEGVTVYTPGNGGKTIFAYSNSLGQVMPGDVIRADETLNFTINIGASPQSLTWKWTGDGYDVVSGSVTTHFIRLGPATNGL